MRVNHDGTTQPSNLINSDMLAPLMLLLPLLLWFSLQKVHDAGAGSAGFGAQRDPTVSGDQEYTARQTQKSTGQDPGSAD